MECRKLNFILELPSNAPLRLSSLGVPASAMHRRIAGRQTALAMWARQFHKNFHAEGQ
jgi:hypothetical protein